MVTTIANPIYDIVFKYLMEDERIARTILSALLQQDIVKVEMRPQEFASEKDGKISLYRIDFGATVRQDDGTERQILIELQKTWVDTEILRFRQYLGYQYSNPTNIRSNYGLPMVTVYLLGHLVGDIEEAVLYVNRKAYDRDGREVTKGLPNPFVDSLTHDSVIVQIPRLHGQINNRLDEVLSFFDQSRQVESNRHLLEVDETRYEGDADMERIFQRLLMAAASSEMRRKMDIEDEIYSALEKRDAALLQKDKKIEEQSAQLEEQSAQLEEQNQMLRNSVKAFREAGFSDEKIAMMLKTALSTIQELTE